jgi:hypothetical protein
LLTKFQSKYISLAISHFPIPFFQNNTDYQLVLQTRISGNPKYASSPLVAIFDISAVNWLSSGF